MRVTNEGPADPVKLATGGTGGTDPPITDCCDIAPDDLPDLAENADGLGDSSAHALEEIVGGSADQNLAVGTDSDGGGAHVFTNPTNANDGNNATYSRLNSGVGGPDFSYLRADLGAAYAISSIVSIDSSGSGVSSAGLTVEYSTDNVSWTPTGLTPVITGGTPWTSTYTPSSPITARYWRLVYHILGSGFFNGVDVNTWQLNGASSLGFAWSLPVPEVIDGDDATYAEIAGPDVVQIDLGAAYRIARSRLRIGTATAGAKTYSIDAWNELDESDRVTLATFSFTGTGSFTAQDVETTWFTTTDYRYFELDGNNENRRIYTWSLYGPTLATNHEHDASLITYDNTASGLTGDTVQEAIDELETEIAAIPAAPSFATPAIVLGTAAAAGAASTVIRSDSTIVAFDATAPTTSAIGDAAATGSAAKAARRDHVHGREALSTATPLVESGSGAIGTGVKSSREDHVHPASTVGTTPLLADDHSTPFVFGDLLQNEAGDDFLYPG